MGEQELSCPRSQVNSGSQWPSEGSWGNGQGFPGNGPLSTFWPFNVGLETVMVLVCVSFSIC